MSVTFTIPTSGNISNWIDLNASFQQPQTGRTMALAVRFVGAVDATVTALQLYWSNDDGTNVFKARTQSAFAKATISVNPTVDGDEGEIVLFPPDLFPHLTKVSGKWAVAMVASGDTKVTAGAPRAFIAEAIEV